MAEHSGPGRSRFKPMQMLRNIERYVEERVEAGLRQWLRAPLQPVEVAKAAARAMEESQAITASGPQVANHYLIRLHPLDFDRFASFRLALLRDVERYLDEEAARLGVRPVDVWQVILEAASSVRPGRVQVDASMAELVEATRGEVDDNQMTSVLRPVRAREHSSTEISLATLVVGEQQYALEQPVSTIGRALDNDIVVSDNRVSRYHAQIEWQGERFRLRDLASTNGTFVGGRRVTEVLLSSGDEISLGGLLATFNVRLQ